MTFKPRIDSHHGGTWESPVRKPRGKASWESLVGKPRGKATDHMIQATGGLHCCYSPGGKRTCMPPLRGGLTPLGRLQKYPKIHVSTGEESSGSSTDSTQGLRPRHRRERNPKWPPSYSHGDWPFLRPPERVPEVPVLSREHLQQLENIQDFLPSGQDEVHFR